MMNPTTLVHHDLPTRQSLRLTPMTFSKKAKLAHQIAVRAVTSMGQTVALQACFNDSCNREDFMKDLVEKAKQIKQSSQTKSWSKNWTSFYLSSKIEQFVSKV